MDSGRLVLGNQDNQYANQDNQYAPEGTNAGHRGMPFGRDGSVSASGKRKVDHDDHETNVDPGMSHKRHADGSGA